MSESLKIALLGYRSHPFVGGQGIYLRYLSKALVEAGHQVDVISGPPYPNLDPRVNLVEIPSLNLFEAKSHHAWALRSRHLKSFSDVFEWFSMLTGGFAEPYTFSRRVAKYMKQHGHHYDLIHDNQCLGHGLLTMQKMGLPVVATIHHPITRDRELAVQAAPNWYHRLLVRRWHNFLRMQKKVARNLNHVVTVSEQSRVDISTAFDIPVSGIKLIYNGIDSETFRPMEGVPRQPYRIITTASADEPLKGLRFLIKAVAELKPDYPQLELMVVGKLKERGQTEALLKSLKLEDSVRFVSGISTEQLVHYYNEATLAVSPSLYEGFGLPAGEAMACEVAVVSTDGGALPEVVGDAGVTVPTKNSEAIAKAVSSLLDDSELRQKYAKAGRRRILEQFSWQKAAFQMTEYYENLIAERMPTSQSSGHFTASKLSTDSSANKQAVEN